MQAASATAEAEARAALRAVVAAGEIERSIAEQSWEPVPGGRRVRETFRCRRVRLDRVAGGVRIHHGRARGRAGGVDRSEPAGTKNTNVM